MGLSRRNFLQLLGTGAAILGTPRLAQQGLEFFAAAEAQEARPFSDSIFQLYDLFRPSLEVAFHQQPVLCAAYNDNPLRHRPGRVYVLGGTSSGLVVKKVDGRGIDWDVMDIQKQGDRYKVMSGAKFATKDEGGVEHYASAQGPFDAAVAAIPQVKAWQDAYDDIFREGREVFLTHDHFMDPAYRHVAQRLRVDVKTVSGRQREELKLFIILDIYQRKFPQLADSAQWSGLTISERAQKQLRNNATTYTPEDVAYSLSGH